MNKNDLINAVSDSANLSKVQAAETVDAVFSAISNELSSGGEVRQNRPAKPPQTTISPIRTNPTT